MSGLSFSPRIPRINFNTSNSHFQKVNKVEMPSLSPPEHMDKRSHASSNDFVVPPLRHARDSKQPTDPAPLSELSPPPHAPTPAHTPCCVHAGKSEVLGSDGSADKCDTPECSDQTTTTTTSPSTPTTPRQQCKMLCDGTRGEFASIPQTTLTPASSSSPSGSSDSPDSRSPVSPRLARPFSPTFLDSPNMSLSTDEVPVNDCGPLIESFGDVSVKFAWTKPCKKCAVMFAPDWEPVLPLTAIPNTYVFTRIVSCPAFSRLEFKFLVDETECTNPHYPSLARDSVAHRNCLVPISLEYTDRCAEDVRLCVVTEADVTARASQLCMKSMGEGRWTVEAALRSTARHVFFWFVVDGYPMLSSSYPTSPDCTHNVLQLTLPPPPPGEPIHAPTTPVGEQTPLSPPSLAPFSSPSLTRFSTPARPQPLATEFSLESFHNNPQPEQMQKQKSLLIRDLNLSDGELTSDSTGLAQESSTVLLHMAQDGWERGRPMHWQASRRCWTAPVELRDWALELFKFVVDGEWVYSSKYPTITDVSGNVNNALVSTPLLWKCPAKSLLVTTSADRWTAHIPLEAVEDGTFCLNTPLPPYSTIMFKFIIDGKWIVSDAYERVICGVYENNILNRLADGSDVMLQWPWEGRDVFVCLETNNWVPLPMYEGAHGIRQLAIKCPPFQLLKFKFLVDGAWRTSGEYYQYHEHDTTVNNFVIPVALHWEGEGTSVAVMWGCDRWQALMPTTRGTGRWTVCLTAPHTGRHEFKFVVDGEWRVCPQYSVTRTRGLRE